MLSLDDGCCTGENTIRSDEIVDEQHRPLPCRDFHHRSKRSSVFADHDDKADKRSLTSTNLWKPISIILFDGMPRLIVVSTTKIFSFFYKLLLLAHLLVDCSAFTLTMGKPADLLTTKTPPLLNLPTDIAVPSRTQDF